MLDATISNNGNIMLIRYTDTVFKRTHLRHSHTGYYSCGADRSGADTYLYCICTRLDKIHGALPRGYISRNHGEIRKTVFHHGNRLKNSLGVTMCRIYDNNINSCIK